ncbi:MAG: MBL fold metallo-hydrolase [Gammaproteobacteria bacterium]|jgi:ribonuclease Z|tara:strand:- start:247 stop:1299 length:1053 start_codon:yes stop_codon:yes gene_type:complete
MKKILILISCVASIFIIGLVSLNSHSVQDRILNIGLENILSNAKPFLDEEDTLKVVVCGSRSPLPSPGRAESCVLVEAGDDIYIFDLGNGSVNNLTQYQVPWPNVKAVLITHMHSDHMADLPDAHLQSWIQGRTSPLKVYGPEGINLVTKGFELAYSADYQYRNEHHGDDMLPMSIAGFNAIQIINNQFIPNDTPGLEILPFVVDHYPVNSAFGFKISYKDRTVVISGDTIHDGSVQKYSQDVDLLVHSAISIDIVERMRGIAPIPQMDKILFDIQDYHTSIEEAGEIARDANVEHLLIYHSIPTPRNALMERVFFRPIEGVFENYSLSDDGTRVIMPVGNDDIFIDEIN